MSTQREEWETGKERAYTKYVLSNTPSYHVVDGDKRKFRGCTWEAVRGFQC